MYSVQLWDTFSEEEYVRLRPLSYACTDMFVACFSLVNLQSLMYLTEVWLPEVKRHAPSFESSGKTF